VLFYRTQGAEDYKRIKMNRSGETDEYTVTLGGRQIKAPGLEYYIEANDAAGNSLLHGYSFSPLSVSVVDPGSGQSIVSQDSKSQVKTGNKSKKWLWIALGALAVGAIAAAAGGGEDNPPEDGAVVVSGPTP
jgi:hypothetical protein